MIESILGVLSGLATIAFARLIRGERWFYALVLVSLPLIYAAFALEAGARTVVHTELVYGLPWIVVGVLALAAGFPFSANLVALLWLAHAGYDLLHAGLVTNPGVPGWYPLWCAAIDVVVAVYLVWLARRLPAGNLRRAR
ncbi:MAG: hypothetical protein HY749_09890 [Gammaproteobacteria bacterium]|nr:hypothetical protein [Gammaproteobacteria bacterium]MBI5617789.1 hypothetical protein [Gammaproteobacteria bacterium]